LTLGSAAQPSTEHATRALAELANHAGARTLVYELRHKVGALGWEPEAMKLLGEVKPPEDDAEFHEPQGGGRVFDPDDAEELVADIRNKRRLVLSTAAELIAEQDPTRLHNLVFSLGPLLLVGMMRVGRIVRLGGRWRPRAITDEVCRVPSPAFAASAGRGRRARRREPVAPWAPEAALDLGAREEEGPAAQRPDRQSRTPARPGA